MAGLKEGARILVIGASRGIGREVTRQALAEGFRLRALARHPDRIEIAQDALETVAADATDEAALVRALDGVDAVVQTLGVPLGPATVLREVTLFSEATRALVGAMEKTGLRRVVAVTGFGSGDSRASVSRAEALPFRAVFGRIYADKTRQEEILRRSGLDWTILRPTILTRGPRSGRYAVLVGQEAWRNGMISRADVADAVLRALREEAWLREAPVLAR